MITKIILLALIAPTAIMYRAGGMAKHFTTQPHWIPMWARQKWIRQWMIPTLWALAFIPMVHDWFQAVMLVCFIGASGGMLGTYWDWLFKFDNYWFAGFFVGLAGFFLLPLGIPWYLILGRSFLLAILWGGWCAIFGNDVVEEFGRGAFATATLTML